MASLSYTCACMRHACAWQSPPQASSATSARSVFLLTSLSLLPDTSRNVRLGRLHSELRSSRSLLRRRSVCRNSYASTSSAFRMHVPSIWSFKYAHRCPDAVRPSCERPALICNVQAISTSAHNLEPKTRHKVSLTNPTVTNYRFLCARRLGRLPGWRIENLAPAFARLRLRAFPGFPTGSGSHGAQ